MAHGHVEMELKMLKIMVAHGHVEMEAKLLKNGGGAWTCRAGAKNVEKFWWHMDM